MNDSNTIEQLLKPIPKGHIKKKGQFSYVPWETFFIRLQGVLGLNWDKELIKSELQLIQPYIEKRSGGKTEEYPVGYVCNAITRIQLWLPYGDQSRYYLVNRDGSGACASFDPDRAVKTAESSSFSKAAKAVGMALELDYPKEAEAILKAWNVNVEAEKELEDGLDKAVDNDEDPKEGFDSDELTEQIVKSDDKEVPSDNEVEQILEESGVEVK